MKFSDILNFILIIVFLFICFSKSQSIFRMKRGAYDLPDGWHDLRNPINQNFECKDDGYYADVDNGCQIFHVCQLTNLYYSIPRFIQHTFICGNGTVFNQITQTCTLESQLSVPCESSPEFFYMNQRIGTSNIWFHSSDVFDKIKNVNNNNRFNAILNNANNFEPIPNSLPPVPNRLSPIPVFNLLDSNTLDGDNGDNADDFEDDF